MFSIERAWNCVFLVLVCIPFHFVCFVYLVPLYPIKEIWKRILNPFWKFCTRNSFYLRIHNLLPLYGIYLHTDLLFSLWNPILGTHWGLSNAAQLRHGTSVHMIILLTRCQTFGSGAVSILRSVATGDRTPISQLSPRAGLKYD